jgi:hypothetical protein
MRDSAPHLLNAAMSPYAGTSGAFIRHCRAASDTKLATVPATVNDVLRSPGQPLDAATRASIEPRFGHDFSRVRVHSDAKAAESAQAVNAMAYTVGNDVVFGSQHYRPQTKEGQRLLAHELAHVVQQSGAPIISGAVGSPGDPCEREAERVAQAISAGRAASVAPGAGMSLIQRQPDLTLTMPIFGAGQKPSLFPPGQEPHLHLEPWIQAYSLLDPDRIREALLALDLSLVASPPRGLTLPATPPSPAAPIVPRGAGPTTPRPASAGDVLAAVMAVPAVRTEITKLRDSATDQLKMDWRKLSTGERAGLITGTASVAAGAIAGIVFNDASRQLALRQIRGRNIPVPLVPGLSVQLNPIGPNQSVMLNLDLSTLARKLGM